MSAASTGDACREARLSLGTYVLGAVEPAERAAIAAHLGTCPGCRTELSELAGLPGLLGLLTEPEVAALAGPDVPDDDAALSRLLQAAAAEQAADKRHRRRRVSVAAAAGFLTAGAASGAIALSAHVADTETGTQVTSATAATVSARIELTPRAWGTQLRLQLSGVAKGQRCRLVVVDPSGATDVAASWRAEYTGVENVTGSTEMPVGKVAAMRIVTPEGRVLVTVPHPRSG